jgi:hypothetical protein
MILGILLAIVAFVLIFFLLFRQKLMTILIQDSVKTLKHQMRVGRWYEFDQIIQLSIYSRALVAATLQLYVDEGIIEYRFKNGASPGLQDSIAKIGIRTNTVWYLEFTLLYPRTSRQRHKHPDYSEVWDEKIQG